MTATQTPCTPEADRFRCLIKTPDPPVQPAARRRYWDDTVMEAVGELRRRLASSRESVVTMALLSVLEVEKTRMRTGRPVSGTQVSNMRDDDGSLPKLGPLEVDQPVVARRGDRVTDPPEERPASGRVAEPTTTMPPTVPAAQVSEPIPPPAAVSPTREQGPLAVDGQPAAVESPTVVARSASGRSERSLAERATTIPTGPELLSVLANDRAAYLELTGTYPEDDFPDWAVWAPFKADPRPHPAELRWRMRQAGTVVPPPTPADAVS